MNKKLYIIGNGFDLHHGINTEYTDFRNHLEEYFPDLFESLEIYYYMDEDSLLWSEFENGLKEFDPTDLENHFNEYLPDYSSDDFRDRDRYDLQYYIQNELQPIQDDLQKAFNTWIASRKIKINIKSKIVFDINALFLNFNYTDVLESVYGISRSKITYIHNKSGENNLDLLFGHAWNPQEWAKQRAPVMAENLDDEKRQEWIDFQSESYDYSVMRAYEEIDSFFGKIYKNCETIIIKNQVFFQNIKDIEEINIYGHSLSEVDKPYFKMIARIINLSIVHWNVSYYSDNEYKAHQLFLESIGIDKSMYQLFKLNELIDL